MSASAIPKLTVKRLVKILPMLRSENEAELLATVRAIKATLAGAGCDLHDLTAHVEDGGAPRPRPPAPFRPDPAPPTAAEREAAAEALRRQAKAMAEEAARRKAELAAKRAKTLEKNKAAKARCEGKGDRAPVWEMLMQQPNRIALILQWIDWFLAMDITDAERERAADLRQAVKFDRLGLGPDGVRRFNGWLVRTFNYRRKTEFAEVA